MENHIRLVFTSKHLSPDKIVKAIGVQGDKVWASGDKRNNSKIIETENGLIVNSRLEKSLDIGLHIESIMDLIDGNEGKLMKFSETPDCEIQLSCAIYCRSAPPLNFEKAITSWIGSMGASLDIDIYFI